MALTVPFFQVVSNTEQANLDFDFVTSSKHKSLKPFVVFYIPKNRFHLIATFLSVLNSLFTVQQGPGLCFQQPEWMVNLHDAIAMAFMTHPT